MIIFPFCCCHKKEKEEEEKYRIAVFSGNNCESINFASDNKNDLDICTFKEAFSSTDIDRQNREKRTASEKKKKKKLGLGETETGKRP